MGTRGRAWWIGIATAIGFAVLYVPVTSFDFVWDDSALRTRPVFEATLPEVLAVTQQELVDPEFLMARDFKVPFDSYRPLLNLSHYAEIAVFGRAPGPMHANNLVLALIGALMAFVVLREVFVLSPTWSAAGAAVFLLHPIQVETVAYISARGDLLAGIFALSAVALAARSARMDRRGWRWLLASGSGLAMAASVLSKESNIGLLPWFVVAALVPGDPLGRRFKAWLPAMVMQGVGLVGVFAIRASVLSAPDKMDSGSPLLTLVGLAGAILEYIRVFIMPFDCSIERLAQVRFYPFAWFIVIPATAWLLLLSWRGEEAKQPLHRQLTLGFAWLGATLATAPVAIDHTGVLSDRYAYVAILGVVVMLLGMMAYVRNDGRLRRPVLLAAGVWCAMLLFVTSQQVRVWRDNETLYTHAVRMTPSAAMAYYRLGHVYAVRTEWPVAIPLLERSIAINPNLPRAHNNLGVALMNTGELERAAAEFTQAIELTDGRHYRAWNNLGLVRLSQGKQQEGCGLFHRALEQNPGYASARQNLATKCEAKP